MTCLQPTRIAVEQENDNHAFVQSRGESLRAVRIGGQAMELVNGHESFLTLSNRGALSIIDASIKFARASCLVSALVNCAFRAKSIWRNPMSSPQ